MTSSDSRLTRRSALAGALGSVLARSAGGAVSSRLPNWGPGIKISVQSPIDPTDDDLLFGQQIGAEYVTLEPRRTIEPAVETYTRWRDRYASAGIKVWNISNDRVHCMEEVVLNLPGRDAKIEEYKQWLRTTAQTGLNYVTYAHMGNGIWSSGREMARGARARALNMNSPERRGSWNKIYREPLSHGRKFSEQEIWDNYTYFIKQVVPLAEELGIRIGIHPDDPPLPELAGVPHIFASFDGFKRALEIANSPNVGMCLCVGCWAEGGKLMGKDVFETIRYFGSRGKLFKVHFRNVNAPLPHFVETLPDAGYMDMHKVMKALRQVNFNGIVIPDHVPGLVGGPRTGTAYYIGYMRAMLESVIKEARG